MHRVMVRTLRGLEAVARTEVHQLLGPVPVALEHRALRFAVPRPYPRLLSLGTVDDIFLVLGATDGIGHRRSSLDGLKSLARSADATNVLAIEALRPLARPGATSLSFRVHVLHAEATLAVRLAERPLHRRASGCDHASERSTRRSRVRSVSSPNRRRGACSSIRRAASAPSRSRRRFTSRAPWGAAVAAAGGLRRRLGALWTEAARALAPSGRLVALLPAGGDPGCARFDAEVAANVRVHGAEAIVVCARC
jgi:hypothetical protein